MAGGMVSVRAIVRADDVAMPHRTDAEPALRQDSIRHAIGLGPTVRPAGRRFRN